jgi:acyl dehydratase
MGPRAAGERAAGVTADLRYEFAFGTYEDALRMVGTRTEPRFAGTAVSGARIQHFAAMVRDPNPSYWDPAFAQRVWGGLVAPPALLTGLLMPPPWVPTGEPPTASIAVRVPLPGTAIINASNDAEYLMPVLQGDMLSVVEEVASVSPEKTTRLGRGHFIETQETYYRGDGAVVAACTNTLFRFTPEGDR